MNILMMIAGALMVVGPVAVGVALKRRSEAQGGPDLLARHGLKLLIITAASATIGSRLFWRACGLD